MRLRQRFGDRQVCAASARCFSWQASADQFVAALLPTIAEARLAKASRSSESPTVACRAVGIALKRRRAAGPRGAALLFLPETNPWPSPPL